ncbi:MAG: hypothetical protein HYX60_06360 [Legionella longbeachae]|nr:hypothetical protein [Legionella longbeachae]
MLIFSRVNLNNRLGEKIQEYSRCTKLSFIHDVSLPGLYKEIMSTLGMSMY